MYIWVCLFFMLFTQFYFDKSIFLPASKIPLMISLLTKQTRLHECRYIITLSRCDAKNAWRLNKSAVGDSLKGGFRALKLFLGFVFISTSSTKWIPQFPTIPILPFDDAKTKLCFPVQQTNNSTLHYLESKVTFKKHRQRSTRATNMKI